MASEQVQDPGTAKKPAPRKRPAKKATKETTSKTPAAKSSGSAPARKRAAAPRASARPQTSAATVAQGAAAQLSELTRQDVEGVVGLERTDDGWTVQVEVVELRRIPSTTDVLAIYDVQVDTDGVLLGYRRVDRYSRGETRGDQ